MNTILVTEPKRGFKAKSRIILEFRNSEQLLKLFVSKSFKVFAGDLVVFE